MSEGEMWGDPATSLGPLSPDSPMPVGPSHLSTPRPGRVTGLPVPEGVNMFHPSEMDVVITEEFDPASFLDPYEFDRITENLAPGPRTHTAAEAEVLGPGPLSFEEMDYLGGSLDFVPTPAEMENLAPGPLSFEEMDYLGGSSDIFRTGPDVAPVPSFQMGDPLPEPVDYSAIQEPSRDEYAGRWYDEGAQGIRTRDRMALVGESGPEIALFPNGTEIIPLDRKMKSDQARRLRRRGEFAKTIDSFEFGGFIGDMGPEVTDLPASAQVMPAGVSEMMTGRPTRQPRSLMRQAGMRAPSAQTISNLLPEEIEVYREMGRMAGIPEKAFEREFRSMVPMGQGGTRQARFTPRGTGRTRYGNR